MKFLAFCPDKPEFSIRYSLKNQQKVKDKLLEDAVRDAFTNAAVLAEVGKVKLRDIVRIDYDWSEVRFESSRYQVLDRHNNFSLREESLDFQPDDIEARDTVSVVWEIE